jgi:hypothetical protein
VQFYKAIGHDGEHAVLAHEQSTGRSYTYAPSLKTWHRDPAFESALTTGTPTLGGTVATLEALQPGAAAALLPTLRPADRRKPEERANDDARRAQVRRSGEVLTSAEVGLLSKDTRHKMSRLPLIKELLEVRSAHKRWTRLYLYEEDGSTRRSAVADLRNKQALAHNTRGWPLTVQHRDRTIEVNGERRPYVVVECKYIKPLTEPEGMPTADRWGGRVPQLVAASMGSREVAAVSTGGWV